MFSRLIRNNSPASNSSRGWMPFSCLPGLCELGKEHFVCCNTYCTVQRIGSTCRQWLFVWMHGIQWTCIFCSRYGYALWTLIRKKIAFSDSCCYITIILIFTALFSDSHHELQQLLCELWEFTWLNSVGSVMLWKWTLVLCVIQPAAHKFVQIILDRSVFRFVYKQYTADYILTTFHILWTIHNFPY